MTTLQFIGDFAEFKIVELNTETASYLVNQPPSTSDIQQLLLKSKPKVFRGFKMNTSIIHKDDIYDIDELDNVFYGIKRIPTKKKTLLFYGIVWKEDYKREMEFNEDQSVHDIPLDVMEYRFSNKVKFNLINIPKTTHLTPSDNLVIENAAIQYPNTHIIELIARRNDH